MPEKNISSSFQTITVEISTNLLLNPIWMVVATFL